MAMPPVFPAYRSTHAKATDGLQGKPERHAALENKVNPRHNMLWRGFCVRKAMALRTGLHAGFTHARGFFRRIGRPPKVAMPYSLLLGERAARNESAAGLALMGGLHIRPICSQESQQAHFGILGQFK